MRTRLMRSKFTLLFMMLGLLLAVPAIAFAQDVTGSTTLLPAPTIQSDKTDYAPGELVTLTGSGWQPGESVHINVNDTFGATWTRNVDVIADASGNITDSFNLPSTFVSDYDVTATGAQSGTATTTFTDSNPNNVSVASPTSATVMQGGSNGAYGDVSVGFSGSDGNPPLACTVTLGVSQESGDTGLPANANAIFGTGTLSGLKGETKTSTLAVSTTNATPTGTYTFHVKATRGTGCQGSGATVSNEQLTLVVTSGDTTAPTVSSINRANANPTNASSVSWNVTFSESVTGVNVGANSDFALAASSGLSGASITGITGSGSTYTVTANTGSGDGTLGLNLVDNDSIVDGAGNKLGGTGTTGTANGSFTGEVYTIDRTAANVTLTDVNGAARTFPYSTNANVTSVGGSCEPGGSPVSVTLGGNLTTPPLAPRSPSGSWTLNLLTPVSSEGTYVFAASQIDTAGNTGSSGNKSVTIDKTAPTVTLDKVNGTTRTFPYSTNANVTSVGGSCTTGDGDVSVTLDGNAANPATANCSSGNWTLTLTNALSNEGTHTFSASQTDAASNTGNSGNKSVNIDKTAPTITGDRSPDANANGWNNTNVTVSYTCSDNAGGSGLAGSCPASDTVTTEGANQSRSGTVTDQAGNSASVTKGGINIDKTPPTAVAFVGGSSLNNGGSYDFNSVPAGPTGCTAEGAISGLDTCTVGGYGTGVGPHTVTATAKDKAGNTATKSLSYTVKEAKASGFYQPVDMNNTLNTVKSGSTVPVKFELFGGASNTEQKTLNAVTSMSASKVDCAAFNSDPVDAIEYLARLAKTRACGSTPLGTSSSTTGRLPPRLRTPATT